MVSIRRAVVGFIVGVLALASVGVAQTNVNHSLVIAIPSVLRLKVDAGEGSSAARVPVAVDVREETYLVTPTRTEIGLLSNGDWQLSVSYLTSEQAVLTWRLAEEADRRRFRSHPQVATSGGPTHGWRSLTFVYGLDTPLPPEGRYRGVVTYTLTRP